VSDIAVVPSQENSHALFASVRASPNFPAGRSDPLHLAALRAGESLFMARRT